jgi:ABC-type Fe3+-siderophore transport system permease subunit
METPIHQERQSLSRVLFFLVIGIVGALILFSFLMVQGNRIFDSILFVIMGIAIGLLLMSIVMKVVVTSTELRFGFPFWRVRCPLKDIEVVAVEPIPILAGVGIHLARGRWVYNARQGDGVHLIIKGKKHYLVGSDNAQALFNVLKEATT